MKKSIRSSIQARPPSLRHQAGLFCALLLGAGGSSLLAQSSVSTSEFVGVSNLHNSNLIYTLSSNGTSDGSYSSTQFAQSFTGLDGSGHTQTMNYSGFASSSAAYGQLHLDAGGTLTNSYYNAGNPLYYDGNTGAVNPDGSPDNVVPAAFANFSDTLQYGGTLQTGYKARYIFHVDGNNIGYGAADYLTVNIAGNEQTFYNFNPGQIDTTYATMDYMINGTTPQMVSVTFAAFLEISTDQVADGSNLSGEADFANTATLAGIEIVDADGNPVSGVTVTSDSGTDYSVVPEPGTFALIIPAALLLLLGRLRTGTRARLAAAVVRRRAPSPF